MYFYNVAITPLRRDRVPLFEQSWIHFIPRMLCSKFGSNWQSGSGESEKLKRLKKDRPKDRRLTISVLFIRQGRNFSSCVTGRKLTPGSFYYKILKFFYNGGGGVIFRCIKINLRGSVFVLTPAFRWKS